MPRPFETGLTHLKEQLISMAGLVESAIEHATAALQARDGARLSRVSEIERKVNDAHKAVDESCVELLATQQPMAADLRLIVAVIKINSDLERMGDQAVNIAHNSERYLKGEALKPLEDVPVMAREVRFMVREAIDAFVKRDELLARDVISRDDRVDYLKDKVFTDVKEHVRRKPEGLDQGLSLILIARNLERIGDHATNIAEDVIYAISGKDVRHYQAAEEQE